MNLNLKRKGELGAGTFEYVLITAITIVLAVIIARGLSPAPGKLYERFSDMISQGSGRSGTNSMGINIGR